MEFFSNKLNFIFFTPKSQILLVFSDVLMDVIETPNRQVVRILRFNLICYQHQMIR